MENLTLKPVWKTPGLRASRKERGDLGNFHNFGSEGLCGKQHCTLRYSAIWKTHKMPLTLAEQNRLEELVHQTGSTT